MDGTPPIKTRQVRCCIAGGGPAGMMLGYLGFRPEHVRTPDVRMAR